MSRIKDEPVTSLAICWRLERPDGGGLALTSHDASIRLGGDEYLPAPGMVPAAVTHRLDLEPSSTEIDGALSSDALSDVDLITGRWDGARVSMRACDWHDPDTTVLELAQGELADVAVHGGAFTAELRGAAWRLNEPVCPSTSPQCRAEFGDKACRVDLAGRSVRAIATEWQGNTLTLDGAVDERVLFGRLRYLSGANCGLETVILGVDGPIVSIRDLPKADVEAGTVVELRQGCDKRLETCSSRFGNAVNFRGEPHLPGMDLLTRYPGA